MASFFNKKVSDLTFEDIESLKSLGIRESEFIDYKEKLPSNDKIAALVTAFANTYGGWIVFGVKEDDDAKPEAIVGVDGTGDDLIGRIAQLCYDRIHPAVLCDATTVDMPENERKVLVVRVFESDLCHAVDGTGHYVKIKATKKPVDREEFIAEADTGRISWLLNRRQKHVELRTRLVGKARQRADLMGGSSGHTSEEYSLEVSVLPMYPRRQVLALDDVYQVFQSTTAAVRDYCPLWLGTHSVNLAFWDQSLAAYRALDVSSGFASRSYLEIGTLGQVFFRLCRIIQEDGQGRYVWLDTIMVFLIASLLQAYLMYQRGDHYGKLYVECTLKGLASTTLGIENAISGRTIRQKATESSIDSFGGYYDFAPFAVMMRDFLVGFTSRLFFVYGIPKETKRSAEQTVETYLQNAQLDRFGMPAAGVWVSQGA